MATKWHRSQPGQDIDMIVFLCKLPLRLVLFETTGEKREKKQKSCAVLWPTGIRAPSTRTSCVSYLYRIDIIDGKYRISVERITRTSPTAYLCYTTHNARKTQQAARASRLPGVCEFCGATERMGCLYAGEARTSWLTR